MTDPNYEPLLDESKFRLTMYPIEYRDIWDFYKKSVSAIWFPEEIDFSKDIDDFENLLNDDERHFIKMMLAFFAASDGIVNFNLRERFTKDIKIQEALVCYDYQVFIENQHSETYSLMLESLVKDPVEKDRLFNAVKTIPSIKAMQEWSYKWIQSEKSFAHRLIAFSLVEAVFFSGVFASIFWFKLYNNKGKSILPSLTHANSLIAKDEGFHANFACLLYSKINNRVSRDDVIKMFKEAVILAQDFATESLPVRLIGMNSDLMKSYIEYIADRLVVDLGYEKIYNSKNPFPFMETIGLTGKINFFEARNSEYMMSKNANNNKALSNLVISDDF